MKTLLINREAERPKTFEEQLKWRLDGLKEQMDLNCLDPELYDVLVALTNRGFFTYSSCSGHWRGDRGCISLCAHEIKDRNEEDLLWILQRFGLKDIEVHKNGKNTTGVSFAAIEGSQYGNGLYDMYPPDADYGFDVPPKPGECSDCGKSDFWLQGELYDIGDTLEWMCKHCQPLSFEKNDRGFQTPEIILKRATLPESKLFKVEHDGNKFPYQIRAENEMEALYQMGYEPFKPNDDSQPFFTRIE